MSGKKRSFFEKKNLQLVGEFPIPLYDVNKQRRKVPHFCGKTDNHTAPKGEPNDEKVNRSNHSTDGALHHRPGIRPRLT
ncbi:MAG: hypothetical protein QF773_08665, partial [Lentisphaeria bacterium]|nr:hypothetical protein [Lentisphaeria bacterium]